MVFWIFVVCTKLMKFPLYMDPSRILTLFVLYLTVSSNARPIKTLEDSPLEWWVFKLFSHPTHEEEVHVRRRILPKKSIFVLPTLDKGNPGPPCPKGQEMDNLGNCKQAIQIDEDTHSQFLLQKFMDITDVGDYDDDDDSGTTTQKIHHKMLRPMETAQKLHYNVDYVDEVPKMKSEQESFRIEIPLVDDADDMVIEAKVEVATMSPQLSVEAIINENANRNANANRNESANENENEKLKPKKNLTDYFSRFWTRTMNTVTDSNVKKIPMKDRFQFPKRLYSLPSR